MLGVEPGFIICPFRGEYFRLARDSRIVNHLILPDPRSGNAFLGVHLTRMIDGSVAVGPNAVLALKPPKATVSATFLHRHHRRFFRSRHSPRTAKCICFPDWAR